MYAFMTYLGGIINRKLKILMKKEKKTSVNSDRKSDFNHTVNLRATRFAYLPHAPKNTIRTICCWNILSSSVYTKCVSGIIIIKEKMAVKSKLRKNIIGFLKHVIILILFKSFVLICQTEV